MAVPAVFQLLKATTVLMYWHSLLYKRIGCNVYREIYTITQSGGVNAQTNIELAAFQYIGDFTSFLSLALQQKWAHTDSPGSL